MQFFFLQVSSLLLCCLTYKPDSSHWTTWKSRIMKVPTVSLDSAPNPVKLIDCSLLARRIWIQSTFSCVTELSITRASLSSSWLVQPDCFPIPTELQDRLGRHQDCQVKFGNIHNWKTEACMKDFLFSFKDVLQNISFNQLYTYLLKQCYLLRANLVLNCLLSCNLLWGRYQHKG